MQLSEVATPTHKYATKTIASEPSSPYHSAEALSFCETYIPPAHTFTLLSTRTITSTFDNNIFQPFTTVTGTGTSTLTTYTTITSTYFHTLPSLLPRTTTTISTPATPRQYPVYPSIPYFLAPCFSSPEKLSSGCSCLVAPITYVEHTMNITVASFGGTTTLPTITITKESTVTDILTTTFTLFEP